MANKRKQATRRRSQRSKQRRPRVDASIPAPAPLKRREPSTLEKWIGFSLAAVFGTLLIVFLLSNQINIARVLLAGKPARATVVSVVDCSSRSENLLLSFSDANGEAHRVYHSTYVFLGCSDKVRAGDSVAIRYVPNDPGTLMTQAEFDALPTSIVLYALCDFIFIGGGGLVLGFVGIRPLIARLRAPAPAA